MWLPKVHTWSKKWRSSTPVCKVISTERSPVYWFLNDSAIFQLQANNQVPFFADLQRKNFFYLRSLLVIVIIIPAHSGQGIIIEIFRRVPEERHQWWNLHFDGKREACRCLPVRYRSRSKRKKPFFLLERKNSLTRLIRQKDFDGRLLFRKYFLEATRNLQLNCRFSPAFLD